MCQRFADKSCFAWVLRLYRLMLESVFITAVETACVLGLRRDDCLAALRERRGGLAAPGGMLGAEFAALPVGALPSRALVKGQVPPRVAVAGTPARVLREGVSWGRSGYAMTQHERASIGLGPLPGD